MRRLIRALWAPRTLTHELWLSVVEWCIPTAVIVALYVNFVSAKYTELWQGDSGFSAPVWQAVVLAGMAVLGTWALAYRQYRRMCRRLGGVKQLLALAREVVQGKPVEPLHTGLAEIDELSIALAQAAAQIAEDAIRLHVIEAELHHRNRNFAGKVQGLVNRAAQTAESIVDLRNRIAKVLKSLSDLQSLVDTHHSEEVSMRKVLEQQLEPYRESIMLEGGDLMLKPKAVESIGLIVSELATNALKHGSLKSPEGHVTVAWWIDGPVFILKWLEHGPARTEPLRIGIRKGFGTTLLAGTLQELGGKEERRYELDGLKLTITFPYPTRR